MRSIIWIVNFEYADKNPFWDLKNVILDHFYQCVRVNVRIKGQQTTRAACIVKEQHGH
jgi:hypothetical protein